MNSPLPAARIIGLTAMVAFVCFLLASQATSAQTPGESPDPAAATDTDTANANASASASPQLGAELFAAQCASCHGSDGEGVIGRGPDLKTEGEASADFVLRTGRMPLAAPGLQATRGPVRYNESEILSLVAHVGSIGDGPGIPVVDSAQGDIARGGALYRLNCAACHVASGAGATIGGGQRAPSLGKATATEVGQAMVVGPGSMPVFGQLDSTDTNDIAAYIENLRAQNTTSPSSFGGAGPVAEGLAAWILGLGPLIALTRWIGHAKDGRDHAIPTDDKAAST